jgi:hypothetical protein
VDQADQADQPPSTEKEVLENYAKEAVFDAFWFERQL